MTSKTLSPEQAAARLNGAGVPTTPSSVRRWCSTNRFDVTVMGRWRIPAKNVGTIEEQLPAAAEEPICRTSTR